MVLRIVNMTIGHGKEIKDCSFAVWLVGLCILAACDARADDSVELTTKANSAIRQRSHVTGEHYEAKAFGGGGVAEPGFVVDVSIDPSKTPTGDLQSIAGFAIGLMSADDDPFQGKGHVRFELREGERRGFWDIWIDGVNEPRRLPSPKPRGWVFDRQYQQPWEFTPREDFYRLRIVGTPNAAGTLLEFYFEHFDRPVFQFDFNKPLSVGHIGFYALTGGTMNRSNTARFRDLNVRFAAANELAVTQSARDVVLDSLDLSHPDLGAVASAISRGDRASAGRLFLEHMRTRETPIGPSLTPDRYGPFLEVADAALEDRYGTVGPFNNLAKTYIDGAGQPQNFVDPDGTIRWDLCHGHLTRHFHWVSLAQAYVETRDAKYVERFSMEVQDWVAREPFLHPQNPDVGGINWMDGTTFEMGYMNTSNIGRRCELTWWPAYEIFRRSPDFTDEAHFHMLLGFLRQSRLIMNPSSFAAHDDGGAHTSVALLQNALMLPELAESRSWEEEAQRRWLEVLDVQFHGDGSHVSLSTGYNWASLKAMENLVALYQRVGRDVPQQFMDTLELAYRHPIALSRPDQGQIDMNDGGWGMIDDHMRRAHTLFPHRDDFLWMATKGQKGRPPDYRSIYFPNAGHVVMRTGWGPKHRYLFMDAGPVGASHGKEDKLNIYVDYGGHQLLASGGRGSYAGGPFTAYTGSTRAYNTLLVDGGTQARIPQRFEIDGHRPEKRRWLSQSEFDFAEGFHTHGWFTAGKHTTGKHTRQILFVKGAATPESSYWVVFDTVEPDDQLSHGYEAMFHIRRDHAEVYDTKACIVHGWDTAAALRIVPAESDGLTVNLVRGQTEPHVQGWHVVGKNRAPMWTPIFHWNATGPTTRAWVLVPAGSEQRWCVKKVALIRSDVDALVFECQRSDGSTDTIYRKSRKDVRITLDRAEELSGEIGVVQKDEGGNLTGSLQVPFAAGP